MKGLSQIKSARSVRSLPRTRTGKPKSESSDYLNLYILTVERERLQKELAVLDRRRTEVDTRLKTLNADIERIMGKSVAALTQVAQHEQGGQGGADGKSWKTMSVDY